MCPCPRVPPARGRPASSKRPPPSGRASPLHQRVARGTRGILQAVAESQERLPAVAVHPVDASTIQSTSCSARIGKGKERGAHSLVVPARMTEENPATKISHHGMPLVPVLVHMYSSDRYFEKCRAAS